MTKTSDDSVLRTITQLVSEEETLYKKTPLDDSGLTRLESIKVELDQCRDLLRQRRALRDAGKDPDAATMRPASIVEKYEQ